MAYDFEELQFGGKVYHVAEKEFAASFTEDTNRALITSIRKEYEDQGKPKNKIAWIRKRLESLFLCVAERPVWVEKRTIPRWPFLNGRPMVFVCQYSLPDSSIVREKFFPGLVLYVFADRHPVEGGRHELRYRVVEQDPAL
jgi:hypothetical protein